jgi:hypothetical protein
VSYCISKTFALSLNAAVSRTTEALQKAGFSSG